MKGAEEVDMWDESSLHDEGEILGSVKAMEKVGLFLGYKKSQGINTSGDCDLPSTRS